MAVRKGAEGPRFLNAFLKQVSGLSHPLAAQLSDHDFGLCCGRLPTFLRMDRLQHMGNYANLGPVQRYVPELHQSCFGAELEYLYKQTCEGRQMPAAKF